MTAEEVSGENVEAVQEKGCEMPTYRHDATLLIMTGSSYLSWAKAGPVNLHGALSAKLVVTGKT